MRGELGVLSYFLILVVHELAIVKVVGSAILVEILLGTKLQVHLI